MYGTSPPEVEWELLYGSIFYDAHETTSGDIVAVGKRWYNYQRTIFLYSSQGEKIWESSVYPYNNTSRSVIETAEGDFIAVGNGWPEEGSSQHSLSVYKVSSDGDALWHKLYVLPDNAQGYANGVTILPDGGFAICGEISPAERMNQAWILRTDSQGDTLWTREWGWEAWDRARGVLCIDSVITVLCSGRLEGDPGGTYIVRYSMDGDLLSQYRIPEMEGEYGFDMCEASDDGLLIVDNYNPLIVHTNHYGYFDWSIWAPGLGQPYGWSIDTTMDGGFIYGGENKADEFYDSSGMISRHDADGTELWRDYVYNSACLCIYSVHQLSQGGYIAAGYANPSLTDGYQGFLMKYLPEMGFEEPESSELSLEVSPSPCSSVLSVSFSQPEAGNASVRVHDLGGRLVSTVADHEFPSGSNTVEWAVPEDFSSGCYFLQYSSAEGFLTESVVLIK